jgi:hypothetical protein
MNSDTQDITRSPGRRAQHRAATDIVFGGEDGTETIEGKNSGEKGGAGSEEAGSQKSREISGKERT